MPARKWRQSSTGTGASTPWWDLSEVYGPWQTAWTWPRRMAAKGTWDTVLATLTAAADAKGLVDWSVSVDSTIARAHHHATRHRGLDRVANICVRSRLLTGSGALVAG